MDRVSYPELKAEIARKGITVTELANKLGVTITTMSLKINGKAPITLSEARQIKEVIGSDQSLEVLFDEAVE